jgi:GntR family transcriptional regulator, transcriptional repressor for pyruvate dehydrogenase complex
VRKGGSGGIFVENTPNGEIGRHLSESIAGLLESDSVTLYELLEARTFLEVPLAGLAASKAGDATVAALEAAIRQARGRDPAPWEFRLADTSCHQLIAVTAGNDLMVTFTGWILDVLQPSLIDHIGGALDGDEIIAQHEHILRAIRRRQPGAAQRAMHDHIAAVQAVLRRVDGA